MSIETALVDHLLGDSDIATPTSSRVYQDIAPQGTALPYITLVVIDTQQWNHFGGGVALARPRVQIDVWAATATSRAAIADAVRLRLQAYHGAMGDEALAVRATTIDGPAHTYEAPTDGSQAGTYRARLDALITHAQTAPS